MPEGPELALAGRYINEACGGLVFSGGAERSAVGRGPEVPFRSEAYRLGAALVFRFGMSGGFRLRPAASPPRHAHLRFLTRESPPRALCFVDARRFGSWRLGDAWQPGRGPCVLSEYQAFRENVLKNLDDKAFDKPICEALLNQKYFNGIGNYLRAEILYRLKIPPFEKARTGAGSPEANSSLPPSKKLKLKRDNPDLLELCHTVPMEVVAAEKNLLDPDHADNHTAFKNWLQCYGVPGMSSLRDHNGRTIWFQVGWGSLPGVTTRASKRRSRRAENPATSAVKKEEEEEEEAVPDPPRRGRARARRAAAAAPASLKPEAPVKATRRRASARKGAGEAVIP
uniref:Nei like DNA glycosylase 1 n=1 Tax=Anas platyrhynchos TaxID=8839 RepID=A0A8B9TLQ5_ANAPL